MVRLIEASLVHGLSPMMSNSYAEQVAVAGPAARRIHVDPVADAGTGLHDHRVFSRQEVVVAAPQI